jgi:hypothetical protein
MQYPLPTTLAGGAIGLITGSSYFVADAVLNGGTHVPLESAIAVGVFVASLVWYLGQKFQKVEDNFKIIEDKFKTVAPLVEKVSSLAIFEQRLIAVEVKCGSCPAATAFRETGQDLPHENHQMLQKQNVLLRQQIALLQKISRVSDHAQ